MRGNSMENEELKKLSRIELLEILVEQAKKIELLQQQLDEANQKLNDREIRLKKVGSIAEASLQLNGVFDAAEKAAQQYVDNIKILYAKELEIYKSLKIKQSQSEGNVEKESNKEITSTTD